MHEKLLIGRPKIADPKEPFSCQMRKSYIAQIRKIASERKMSVNNVVELAYFALLASLLAENRESLPGDLSNDNNELFAPVAAQMNTRN